MVPVNTILPVSVPSFSSAALNFTGSRICAKAVPDTMRDKKTADMRFLTFISAKITKLLYYRKLASDFRFSSAAILSMMAHTSLKVRESSV